MKHHLTTVAIAAIVAFGIGYLPKSTNEHKIPSEKIQADKKIESAYQRVLRTGTLRCGYALYAPMLSKDPNTGEMSGIAADVINAVAKSLDLKVEWTAEFGFATSISDLESDRFDLTCIGFWRLPLEAKRLTYTVPFLYSQMNPYIRADDTRFDGDYSKINEASIRIISADGQMSSSVARTEFPKAQLIELPNMASISQQMEEVASGKADIVLDEPAAAEDYMIKNPGKLRKVEAAYPLRVFQNTFAMKMGENDLKTMLDSALIDVIENGEMDKILAKYDPDNKIFKKVAKGYQP
ncbi:MAG: hypothetical protein DI586_00200 [Micavibrio aeruginosavorus]|uniref:Solute-binding protein family 3/N-terminal domain-containing protein n=1 Tax=Micavibrio aeruginosavorus TaxID=349221 RepID=A0A2W5FNF2_9BACT|nr:MAG: hypothetical protein DI586_00200 [Micavibrio aeruginosavorus]